MRIHVLALNGAFDTGLAAVLDAFCTANALAEMTGNPSLHFQVKLLGLHKRITTARGLGVAVMSAARAHTPRRMQTVLGKSPLAFFQDLRIERAVHLLKTGRASVDQIATQVGYANGLTLRALLRRKLGRGVGEIRRSL